MNSALSRACARVFILACLVSCIPFAHAAIRSRDLPPRYRHWFEEEVNYIIDSNEKKQFLTLTTDAERDAFIAEFWRIRNPDPDSGTNPYKDEHYRRLAYANEHFGSSELQNGWRSDKGRIYITLGAPKQIVDYPAARNVRPLEIWFYQSPSLALPSYFNIMFFKPSAGEPYKIYSPNSDGPAHLVASLEAMNDQKRSLDMLRKSLGDEVAKTAISLIPSESVSFDDYTPSLSSDMLLSQIAGLPDNPVTQAGFAANKLREKVTMSVLVGDQNMSIGYDVFRDELGRQTLSYLLGTGEADPRIVGSKPDKTPYYDLTLRTIVMTPQGKEVYQQEDQLKSTLTPDQAEVARKKKFAAEARVPLAPGTYLLDATLTDNVNHLSSRHHVTVTVPTTDNRTVGLSNLLAYTTPAGIPDPNGQLPFSASHYRFTPHGAQTISIRQGDKLPLVFQLWLPSGQTAGLDKIHLRFVFGDPASHAKEPTVETEDVDATNHDKAGNFVTGHTIDTSDWGVGTYMLVASAKTDSDPHTAYSSMTVHVLPPDSSVGYWTAYGAADAEGQAVDDLKRGMSAEAQDHDDDAQGWYVKALAESSSDMRPLTRLVALLKRHDRNQQLAELSKQPILAGTAVDPEPLLAIAQALKAAGDTKAEISMLETQIKLQQPNAGLYLALADAYSALGDNSRAENLRQQAAKVK